MTSTSPASAASSIPPVLGATLDLDRARDLAREIALAAAHALGIRQVSMGSRDAILAGALDDFAGANQTRQPEHG